MTVNMKEFAETFDHLAADPEDPTVKLMLADVGKKVRFNVPGTEPARTAYLMDRGLVGLLLHQIVGVQKIHDGSLAYRVQCLEFDDQVGRPMTLDNVVFMEKSH